MKIQYHKKVQELLKEHLRNQIEELEEELKEFNDFLLNYREKYPVLIKVAEKICEWRFDDHKSGWLFPMFCEPSKALYYYTGFLGTLRSFLINACLDDSGFEIKWMVNRNTRWGIRPIKSTRENPRSRPVVFHSDRRGDPAVLLEAMVELEKRELEHDRWVREIEEGEI